MRVLFLSVCIVIADQITKLLVKGISIPSLNIHHEGMRYGFSRPVFGEFFRLTFIENPGMAFGIDLGGKLFFSIFSVIASGVILFYLYKVRSEPLGLRLSLALILGGAVGNLIDRVFYGVIFDESPLFYGKVVDFLDVDFFNVTLGSYSMTRWPVFNIADASVTVGVLLLLIFHRHVTTTSAEAMSRPLAAQPVSGTTPASSDPPSSSLSIDQK